MREVITSNVPNDKLETVLYRKNVRYLFDTTEGRCIIDESKLPSFSYKETIKGTIKIEIDGKTYENPYTITIKKINRKYYAPKYDINVRFNIPIGNVVRRKNSSKNISSVAFSKDMFDEEYKNNIKKAKDIIRRFESREVANKIIFARENNLINDKKLALVETEAFYYNLPENKRKDFLIANNFRGIENYGIYEERPDRYGHKTGRITKIDFKSKNIFVVGFSSDD